MPKAYSREQHYIITSVKGKLKIVPYKYPEYGEIGKGLKSFDGKIYTSKKRAEDEIEWQSHNPYLGFKKLYRLETSNGGFVEEVEAKGVKQAETYFRKKYDPNAPLYDFFAKYKVRTVSGKPGKLSKKPAVNGGNPSKTKWPGISLKGRKEEGMPKQTDRLIDLYKQGFMKQGRGKKPIKYEVIDSVIGLVYHGENKYEADRIARQYGTKVIKVSNPYLGFKKLSTQLAKKPGIYSPGGLARTIGIRKYGPEKFAAMQRRGVRQAKGNPSTFAEAESLSEAFHGRGAKEVATIEEAYKYPDSLTKLGKLTELEVLDDTGEYAIPIEFKAKQPDLCSTPNAKQLVIVGGDQKLDPRDFEIEDNGKQYVDLGYLHTLSYYTDKHQLEEDAKDGLEYIHELGEDTGEKPMLVYDCLNQKILVVGGAYTVEDRGIVN